MKTITYNPETHVLVPRDLIADAKQIFCSDVEPNTNGDCLDVIEWFSAMIAAAPQPESVDGKPVEYLLDGARFKLSFQEIGCDECGTESPYVLVTPLDHYANELNGKWVALVPAENDRHLHIAAQPDRVAELEQLHQRVAELEKERDDWQDEALGSRINVETLRAERDDAITNLRVEQIAHLSLTDLLEKENEQLKAALKADNATAWAQAHRLALELECLLLDTKDNAIVSKWWDSGMAALNEYQQLKPGAAEEAEAWAKMRKEML